MNELTPKDSTVSQSIPEVTGVISYEVRVICPHCKNSLYLNQYPYNDDRSDYSRSEDDLGAALFGSTSAPAKWSGLDIQYACWGCNGLFSVCGLEV